MQRFNHRINSFTSPYSLVNSETKWGYIPIPKCACSFGIPFFKFSKCWNFNEVRDFTTQNSEDYKFIVFLRDPIKRWSSGIAEYFHVKKQFSTDKKLYGEDLKFLDNDVLIKTIIDATYLDIHTAPQTYFLEGLDLNKLICFNIDDHDFDQKLQKLCEVERQTKPHTLYGRNKTSGNLFKKKIKEKFDSILKNPTVLKQIKSRYANDYELIEQLKVSNKFYE